MNTYHPVVTAILSYGMSGEVFHAPLLHAHPGFRLKTIWQRTSDKAKLQYPSVQIVRRIEEILHDPEIELVVVNTINDTHFDFARRALEAGKHVIVEKPLTPTVEEGNQLIALAKQKGRILSVFQNRRWDGGFLTTKHVIEWGMLGKIVEFEAHYDRFRNYIEPNTWKEMPGAGSGILYNLGSHLLDQINVLFGMPEAVDARVGIQRPGGSVADFYDMRLIYPDVNVIVKSSYLVREAGPLYTVHGTKGSFLKYGVDPQEAALKLHQTPGTPGWGTDPENLWGKINTEINGLHVEGKIETIPGNYLGFYQNIYEAIRDGKPLAVTAEQALEVIQLIEAAMQSNAERRAVKI